MAQFVGPRRIIGATIIGGGSTGSGGAAEDATYVTTANELADLANSQRLVAGLNVTFTPGPGTLEISAAAAGSELIDYAYRFVNANYTVDLALDALIEVDATGADRTITLPKITAGDKGRAILIKKKDASVNLVNVATTGGDTFDDIASPFPVSQDNSTFTFVADGGSNWVIL